MKTFKAIDSGIGKLRYHVLNPSGAVVATFRDFERAKRSAEVMNQGLKIPQV